MDDLYELLPRIHRVQNFFALGLFEGGVDEAPDDPQVDIRVQEGELDLLDRILDVFFGNGRLAAERTDDIAEFSLIFSSMELPQGSISRSMAPRSYDRQLSFRDRRDLWVLFEIYLHAPVLPPVFDVGIGDYRVLGPESRGLHSFAGKPYPTSARLIASARDFDNGMRLFRCSLSARPLSFQ